VAENNQELENLKIIYSEIIMGCSYSYDINLYIKHFNDSDNTEILKAKRQIFQSYKKDGIPSQEDRLKQIIENGDWSQKDEDQINHLKLLISDNEKTVLQIIPQQREGILKAIELKREELISLILKKREIIGSTIEEFVNRDIVSYITFFSLYKDKECKIKAYESLEFFESLEDIDFDLHIITVDNVSSRFSENNIKKIAALPFFINLFSYCGEDIGSFLKIPIINWTDYQHSLISLGSRNISLLKNADGQPPDIITDLDILKSVEWYDMAHSISLGKRNTTRKR
jgi:hypothetical protein